MTLEKKAKFAVFISLSAHLVFLGVSAFWWIPGTSRAVNETRRMFRLSPETLPDEPPRRDVIQSYAEKLKFENPMVEPRSAGGALIPSTGQVEMPQEIRVTDKKELAPGPSPRRMTEDRALAKENVIVIPKKIDSPTEADRFEPADSAAETGKVEVPEPYLEKMYAFTPPLVPTSGGVTPSAANGGDSGRNPPSVFSGVAQKGFKGRGRMGSLERFMEFKVSTWRDPRDGAGYYEIRIRPGRDAKKLASMPKEVLFLVDSSLSIRGYRIDEFKKGIVYCLQNLNAGDHANIYNFKDDIHAFSPEARPSDDPALLGNAIRFLNALEPSEKTDIYDALSVVTEVKPRLLPSYMVLLSDGRPTQGITSSERIIAELTRRNLLAGQAGAGKRSIFAFSGGKRVNRYLLDFLSYQNRGWSEYAVNGLKIRAKIQEFYDKIRDPLLFNLRYQLAQLDPENAYPKHLPDFFRNAEFVIYGTFEEEGEFSLRIVGEVRGREKEVIFAGNLAKAERGGPEIGTAWAANKVYYLIGRMTLEGADAGAENEVLELSRKFNLKTPYEAERAR